MKLTFGPFTGALPRLLPEQLPEGAAAYQMNARAEDGLIKPLGNLGPDLGETLAPNTRTLFWYPHGAGFWLSFDDDADVVLSPVSGNNEGRVYWTRPSEVPQMSVIDVIATAPPYPSASYDLGVPRPEGTITVTVTGTLDPEATVDEIVGLTYTYTYVSAYGEEGQPVAVSDTHEIGPDQTADLTIPGTGPGGNRNITHKRLYRDDGGQGYRLLVELPVAVTEYHDDTEPYTVTGAELESWEWDPPQAGLRGLTAGPNGVLAGFDGNSVYLCEPYWPHAWPSIYRQRFTHKVVGLVGTSQGFVVLTEARPWLLMGTEPATVQQLWLDHDEGCLNKASIVDAGEFALYAGPNGLSAVSAQGAQLITGAVLDLDDWKALAPATIRAYQWDGWYLGFYDNGTVQGGFLWPIRRGDHIALTDRTITAAHQAATEADLTVVANNQLQRWDAGAPLVHERHSRVIEFSTAMAFSCLRLRAESDLGTDIELWLDGALHTTLTPTNNQVIRFASQRCRTLQLRTRGRDVIRAIELAGNPWELGA